jgi:hypothetical protein
MINNVAFEWSIAFIYNNCLVAMKNILIKGESDSSPSSERTPLDLHPLLQKLSIKVTHP